MCTISLIVDAEVLKRREEEFYSTGTMRRPQTCVRESDNAFIMLERIQNEAGAGERAWLDPDPAAAREDWLRRKTQYRDEVGRCCRSGSGNQIKRLTKFCQLVSRNTKEDVLKGGGFFRYQKRITKRQF